MRPFSLLIASLMSLSAFAETKAIDPVEFAEAAANGSIFQKLEGLFHAGSVPNFQPPAGEAIGFIGRCFDRTCDDAVKGSAYLVRSDDGRNGPIGCGLEILSLWNANLTQYDTMCVNDLVRGANWNPASIEHGSLRALLDHTTGSFLRVNGPYYIEKLAGKDGRYASHYCYYYKPMNP